MDEPSFEVQSDDEVFIGPITLKEIKKIFCKKGLTKGNIISKSDLNTAKRLYETPPHHLMKSNAVVTPASTVYAGSPCTDDSFIQMEDMVSKLCMSPSTACDVKLNNTLEIVDHILNHGPNKNTHDTEKHDKDRLNVHKEDNSVMTKCPSEISSREECTPVKVPHKDSEKTDSEFEGSPTYYTPAKNLMKIPPPTESVTPLVSNIKKKLAVFKTPADPSTLKKHLTPRNKIGPRNQAYQNIISPIALYIKNKVPLGKDVHPKKPSKVPSSIPKLIRHSSSSKIPMSNNKENINSIPQKSVKKMGSNCKLTSFK